MYVKSLYRHLRNTHGEEVKTRRSHLIGKKLSTKEPEDIVLTEGEGEGTEELTIDPIVFKYIGEVFDGILFTQCIESKGRFYDDYVAPQEEDIEELKAQLKSCKGECEIIKKLYQEQEEYSEKYDIMETKYELLEKQYDELEEEKEEEVKALREDIKVKNDTIEEQAKIIEELKRQLEEAKKPKEPEPEAVKPKIKVKFIHKAPKEQREE